MERSGTGTKLKFEKTAVSLDFSTSIEQQPKA